MPSLGGKQVAMEVILVVRLVTQVAVIVTGWGGSNHVISVHLSRAPLPRLRRMFEMSPWMVGELTSRITDQIGRIQIIE